MLQEDYLKHEMIVYTDTRGRAPLREYLKDLNLSFFTHSGNKAGKRRNLSCGKRKENTKIG